MMRRDTFELTVHFYPNAASAGVRPVIKEGFGGDWGPEHYRPHRFTFDKPPSRADFFAMCRRFLPWTQVWEKDLFPLLAAEGSTAWPMMDDGHKAADSPILDANGVQVGRLFVSRDSVYVNEGYDRNRIFLKSDTERHWLNAVAKEKREAASLALMHAENRIQEAVSLLPADASDDVVFQTVNEGIKNVLTAGGFIGKGSRKAKV